MRTCVCASDSDRRKGLVRMSDGIPNMLGHIAAAHAAGMSGPEALRAFNLRLDPSATEAEAEADLAEPMQLMARAEAHARRLEQMTDAERRAYAEAFVEDKEACASCRRRSARRTPRSGPNTSIRWRAPPPPHSPPRPPPPLRAPEAPREP